MREWGGGGGDRGNGGRGEGREIGGEGERGEIEEGRVELVKIEVTFRLALLLVFLGLPVPCQTLYSDVSRLACALSDTLF